MNSQTISKVTTITQEADITVEAYIMVEEDIITKVNIKTILQEEQDAGYVTKRTISVQNAHTKIGLT